MAQLSQLGTITDENVSTSTGPAPARMRPTARSHGCRSSSRRFAPSRRARTATGASPRSTTRIERLQRGEATTRRTAHYATVDLHSRRRPCTVVHKHKHGPLHGVGVALTWLGIGARLCARLRHAGRGAARAHWLAPAPCGGAARTRSSSSDVSCAKTRNVGSPTGSSANSGLMQPSPRRAATRRSARPRPGTSAAAAGRRGSHRTRAAAARPRAACRGRSRRRTPSACTRRTCAPTPRTSRRTGTPRARHAPG